MVLGGATVRNAQGAQRIRLLNSGERLRQVEHYFQQHLVAPRVAEFRVDQRETFHHEERDIAIGRLAVRARQFSLGIGARRQTRQRIRRINRSCHTRCFAGALTCSLGGPSLRSDVQLACDAREQLADLVALLEGCGARSGNAGAQARFHRIQVVVRRNSVDLLLQRAETLRGPLYFRQRLDCFGQLGSGRHQVRFLPRDYLIGLRTIFVQDFDRGIHQLVGILFSLETAFQFGQFGPKLLSVGAVGNNRMVLNSA